MKTGVLLIQLGTPTAPKPGAIRRYLRQFLGDWRVISMPAPLRLALLYGVILPFRPGRVAHAYQQIWTDRGSPLMFHTQDLATKLAAEMGEDYRVTYAMRYGEPSISRAVRSFRAQNIRRLVVVPLYPHDASSTTGSSIEALYKALGSSWHAPALTVVPAFFDQPGYLESVAKVARGTLTQPFDHYLFSYHGLPENHLRREQPYCFSHSDCCARMVQENAFCYRAQCFATTQSIAQRLDLARDRVTVAFQSRVGRGKWIQPYTDVVIEQLAEKGVKKLAVFCLSFTADCLETLEEIGIRGRDSFLAAGGEDLRLVPALNATDVWVRSLGDFVRSYGPK